MKYQIVFFVILSAFAEDGFRRVVTEATVKPSAEIFGELDCHNNLPLFNLEALEPFQQDVIEGKVIAGIPQENKSYYFEYELGDSRTMKFTLWRVGNNVFGEIQIRDTPESIFHHYKNLVWYASDSVDCFRVLPEGCVSEENVKDTFVDICEGYETVHQDIQEGLIQLAVNNSFDPQEASYEIAECIKTKINTYSLKMECVVDGLEHMDEEMMNDKWNALVRSFEADATKTNVKTDKSTWSITYDEVEIHEKVGVRETGEDYLLGPQST